MLHDEKLASALREIESGSAVAGRWLDATGTECEAQADGAVWHEYTQEEQAEWIETCAAMARHALADYSAASAAHAALLQQTRDALALAVRTIDSAASPEAAKQVKAAYEALAASVPT